MQTHQMIIGMGSNTSTAAELLKTAVSRLREMAEGEVVLSTPEETEPIDFVGTSWFTNQVAWMSTGLEPADVVRRLKRIERQAGRTKAETRQGIVRLDLDLLWVDGCVLRPDDWQRPYIQRGVAEIQTRIASDGAVCQALFPPDDGCA